MLTRALAAALGTCVLASSSLLEAREIKLHVEGDRQTGIKMAEQLNKHGKDKDLQFLLADQDFEFRVAVYTEGMSTADVLFGGGADSSAVVLSPQCEMLFVVTRSGRMTESGALNAVTNALVTAAIAFGAASIAFAIFLILELGEPYTGLFRVQPAALEQTIQYIDK